MGDLREILDILDVKEEMSCCLPFKRTRSVSAIVFVVFDVETVFVYPWAISFDVLEVSVFIEAFIFVLILIVGLVYVWRKGALEWS